MVKLSLVVGILALASSANAACDYAKCSTDYSTAFGAAAGDMTKTCAAANAWVDCFGGLTGCSTAEQLAVDMAKKGMTTAMSQMLSRCTGGSTSSGGGDSGSTSSGGGDSGSSGCDQMACKDPIAKFTELVRSPPPSGSDFTFKAFNDYCDNGLTVIGAYTKCAAANGCAADSASATGMEQIKESLEATCKAGPKANAWMEAAAKDAAFVTCVGDKMPTGGAGPTCDQAKKFYECGKDFPAGTALNEACEAFKTDGAGCDMTCPKASTGAAADSSPASGASSGGGDSGGSSSSTCDMQKCTTDYNTARQAAAGDKTKTCAATKAYVDCFGALTDCGAMQSAVDTAKATATSTMSQMESMCGGSGGGDTGAASSTQVSAAVLVAAVAFVGMAN